MNKQQLASKIWASANKMRSKIEANEYKDYILGFIFYKFVSDKEERQLRKDGMTDEELVALSESNKDAVRYCQDNLGYFIAYDNLFSTWLKKDAKKEFSVSNVQDALTAFARLIVGTDYQHVFDKIFDTLQMGLRKLGDSTGAQTKAVAALLQLIKDIPMDGRQDYDVLGFIYEYLISNFAANAGKKAGEFYTPHEVSVMMSEIIAEHLKNRKEIRIYDPTSGSGSLLINIGKSISKHIKDRNKIKYYAQELKENTYNLTRMNLVMRGIEAANIATRNADTLEDDWPMSDEIGGVLNPLYVDAVVSNPPYSQNWLPDDSKKSDPRYSFGLAPKSKADYAFLLHDLYHIKPDGIMTIVLPHGVLFRGDEEGEIRKNLIEHNHIDAVIGLPPDIFFGTGIPTIVMVLKKNRPDDGVLFVDASRGFVKSGKQNTLRACDIRKIVDAVVARKNISKFSRLVSRDEIRENDYNLNIPRYVDSSDAPTTWDLYATMAGGIPEAEIDSLDSYWKVFRGLRSSLFKSDGTPYAQLKDGDLRERTEKHKSVQSFREAFTTAVSDFPEFLAKELLDGMMTLSVVQEEDKIAADIFHRLEDVPLINPYDAYQHLAECWTQTANDVEMIQQEGFGAVRLVDPNMVIKKKDGKDTEVQDGWVGHIIPFELVQKTLLADEAKKITDKERELEDVGSQLTSLIDEMEDDDKEKYLNDNNDAFDGKKVNARVGEIFMEQFSGLRVKKAGQLRYLKENGKLVEGSIDDILVKALTAIEQEKTLKKTIKEMRAALHELTKQTIESLSDADARMLLEAKWITPLYARIYGLVNGVINSLVDAVKKLAAKYAETFNDVEAQMCTAEAELSGLLDDLTGDEFDMKGIAAIKRVMGGVR